MLFTIIIGLYTSRVVLKTLGVSDYGVYNVVGGIVAMLSFLNAAMVSASQRFISFELGTGNIARLKKVFCTSVFIHVAIALLILLVAETVGLWFLNTHMNIAADRIVAANWVYQCSIVTFMLTIISVPYDACIVAHEHMSTFAYISIAESVSKLLIVYVLMIVKADKLIVYAVLLALVALILRLTYQMYCRRHFQECRYHFLFDRKLFLEMFSFAGWSIVGNLGFSFKDQASNIILNLFFGTVVNAARGVAMQVNGIINSFSSNFLMALNPQITKQYASGNEEESMKLVYEGCKFSFFLLLIITIPFMVNMQYLLRLWLGVVPQYTAQFLQLALVAALFNSMAGPLVTAMQATGKIRDFQIVICIVMLSELPLAYAILKLGGKPYMAMYPTILVSFIGLLARFVLLKRLIPQYSMKKFSLSVFRNTFIAAISFFFSVYIHSFFPENFISFLITTFLSFCIVIVLVYTSGLTIQERSFVVNKIIKIIHPKFHV